MSDNSTRDALIKSVHLRAGDNQTAGVFSVAYRAESGERDGGEASSAHGAMFAPMALHLPIQIESSNERKTSDEGGSIGSNTRNAGAITGIALAGAVTIISIFLAIFFWCRRQHKNIEGKEKEKKPDAFPAHKYPTIVPPEPLHRRKRSLPGLAPTPAMAHVNIPQHLNRTRRKTHEPTQDRPTIPIQNLPTASIQDQTTVPTQDQPTPPQPGSSSTNSIFFPTLVNNVGLDIIQDQFSQLRRDIDDIRANAGVVYDELPPRYQAQ